MIDIVITYELPQRELESAILLQECFRKKGYSCEIVKYPFDNPIMLRKKYFNNVRCVIVESLYDTSVLYNIVYSVFGRVPYALNSHCEQVWKNATERDKNSYFIPKGEAQKAYHLCWGSRPAELLQESGIKSKHTPIVGPIHMDFFRTEFADYYLDVKQIKNKYGIDENKKIMLFISSFSYANLGEYYRKTLVKKVGEKFVDDFEYYSINTQNEVLKWFKSFLDSNDEYVIIYRKHPSEIINNSLKELKDNYHNFKLISDYSVKQWITVSDVILVWMSTSIAESFFASRQFCIIRPIAIDYDYEVPILNDAHFITTYNEFEESVKSNITQSVNEKTLRRYYDVSDDPTCIRILRFVEFIINDESKQFNWDSEVINNFNKKIMKERIQLGIKKFGYAILDYLIKLDDKYSIVFSAKIGKKLQIRRNSIKKSKDIIEQSNLLFLNRDLIVNAVSLMDV